MKKLDFLLSILYYPVYVIGWVLHAICRIGLALSYTMMLDFKIAKDIIKYFWK